jgi:hypothetical protein
LSTLAFILIVNPLICLIAAIHFVLYHQSSKDNTSKAASSTIDQVALQICYYYKEYLLHPSDWFSFWRMNCRLVSYHSYITKSKDYRQEDKWTFLTEGKEWNVPISPYLTLEAIVCKNKNIEGGMGIFFYKNAACGGDWIIQETLSNADWLKALLPMQAPLSTMRIITSSRYPMTTNAAYMKSYHQQQQHSRHHRSHSHSSHEADSSSWKIFDTKAASENQLLQSDDEEHSSDGGPRSSASTTHESEHVSQAIAGAPANTITALSAVLRLGRAGAATDHAAIFYNVDLATGMITHGTSNAHWYQVGLSRGLRTSWRGQENESFDIHPDPPHPQVVGKFVPSIAEAIAIVTE